MSGPSWAIRHAVRDESLGGYLAPAKESLANSLTVNNREAIKEFEAWHTQQVQDYLADVIRRLGLEA